MIGFLSTIQFAKGILRNGSTTKDGIYVYLRKNNLNTEKMETNKTIEWLKSNWTFVLILILLALLMFQCHRQPVLADDLSKQKIENANNKVNELAKQNAYIENQKELLRIENNKLDADNLGLQKKIADLKVITKTKTDKVKTFSKADIALFYDKRYNLPTEVKTTANGTEISDTIAKLNITELYNCDATFSELNTTKQILENTTKEVVVKDSLWHMTTKQYNNANMALGQKDIVIDAQKQQVADSQKQFKSERLKKNIWKIGTFGALAVILKMILIK